MHDLIDRAIIAQVCEQPPAKTPYEEGLKAGRLSPHGPDCPYDGRTKAGRAWWKGFMAGDAERCAKAQDQCKATTSQEDT